MQPGKKEITENANIKNRYQLVRSLQKGIHQLQSEREASRPELQRHRRKPFSKVGYAFLCFGIIALVASIIYDSSILAFIGLGLTLWGGLFLFIRPVRYVKAILLDSTVISSLTAIDKILTEMNYQGHGIYLPPQSLKGPKEGLVFVPTTKEIHKSKTKELAQGKAFINPDGIYLTPPGQGLLALYEKKLGIDLLKADLDYLITNLPNLLVEDLEIVEYLEISQYEDKVCVKMRESIYEDLCSQVKNSTSICSRIGCPLCSSIACALAKVTGKPVVIEKNEPSPDRKTVEVWYQLIKD